MRTLAAYTLVAVYSAIMLAGCPTTPIRTPREGVAACYYTVRAAFDTAADLRDRKQLSDAGRAQVLKIGDQALRSCDTARAALTAGDVTTAESTLKAAEAILLQLEAALKEKK